MTLEIRVDPALMEAAVLRELFRRDDLGDESARAALGGMGAADGGGASAARPLALRLFEDLGLAAALRSQIDRFQPIALETERVVVLAARRACEEGADVFHPDPAVRPFVVARLRPETIVDVDRLTAVLSRELTFVADMLDPAFGYAPASVEELARRDRLVKDRYMTLWALTVEARLSASAVASAHGGRPACLDAARRVFSGLTDRAFARLIAAVDVIPRPNHAAILDLAMTSDTRFGGDCPSAEPRAASTHRS